VIGVGNSHSWGNRSPARAQSSVVGTLSSPFFATVPNFYAHPSHPMTPPHDPTDQGLKQHLAAMTAKLPPGEVSIGELVDSLGRDGMLLFCVFLCLPFLLPVQIPGISTVFGFLILFIGFAIAASRDVWLPQALRRRTIASQKMHTILERSSRWVDRVERMSRPRVQSLVDGAVMHGINGSLIVIGALLLMVPFAVVPFTNTLPAMAILFLAVGIMQRDGVCILIGICFNLLTIVYFSAIAILGVTAIKQFFTWVPGIG
jgi:hypothetical protein